MTRTLGRRLAVVMMAVSVATWAAAGVRGLETAQPSRTVNDGVYTVPQAERGAKIFDSTCTACHDTGRFTGDEFVSAWAGKPLAALFDVVQTMPEDNPGSLEAQQYGDVIAFFLQLNQYPAGDDELKGDAQAMADIAMAARP
ncbi:MAG: cytochrome c [Acidobacteriota bacterium]|nr:cytochrome c [Acidobacteriota bacterium]